MDDDDYDTQRFNGASLLEIRQAPRQFCDPDTVAELADRVMIVEAELRRVQKLSLSECGIGFVDVRVLMPNAKVSGAGTASAGLPG